MTMKNIAFALACLLLARIAGRAADHGITAEIDGIPFSWTVRTDAADLQSGRFVDGMPWVVAPPEGLQLVATTPARENDAEVEDRKGKKLKADTNITVINPPVGDFYADLSGAEMILAPEVNAFGWDSRGAIMYGTGRKFDPSLGWDGEMPVDLKPGDIVTTPKSFVAMEQDNNNPNYQYFHETVLEATAVLTVLAEVPPEDAFRPGLLRSAERRAKPEFFRVSDIIPEAAEFRIPAPKADLFGNAIDGVPPQFSAAHLTSLLPGPDTMVLGFNDARGSHSYRNNSRATYASDISMVTGDAAIGAFAEWLTPKERKACLIRVLQRSIDVYEALQAGLIFSHDGGMMTAYGLRMALAGFLFDHEGMKGMDKSVHGKEPWFFLSDYAQCFYLGDPENPGKDAPPSDSPRFIPWDSTEAQLRIPEVAVAEADDGWLQVPDDFRWPSYRPARGVPNLKLRVISGPGAGPQVYTVTGLTDFTNADNGAAGTEATPRVQGGRLTVKPAWADGMPTAESKVEFFPAVRGEANRWVFKSSGNIRRNRTLDYDPAPVSLSPINDYAPINVGAYLSLVTVLHAIGAQDAYNAGLDKWMITISGIPGYGEVIFDSDRSRNAANPRVHPAHPDRPFLGGLWKEQVLDRAGVTFAHEGQGLNGLPVHESAGDEQE